MRKNVAAAFRKCSPNAESDCSDTFTVLKSAVECVLAGQRRPGQRVDLIIVSTETVHHLAFFTHIDQNDHPIFVS